jgi:hypothetical protein
MEDLHAITQNSIQDLLKIGVVLPSVQEGVYVPQNYSEIPNMGEENIGDLMGRISSYVQYIEYQTSLAEVDYETWNYRYDFERKKIMLTLSSERRDLMEAKADSQLELQKNNLMQRYSKMKLLKAILEGQKRIADSLSRELSRRSLVYQMQRCGL